MAKCTNNTLPDKSPIPLPKYAKFPPHRTSFASTISILGISKYSSCSKIPAA